MKKMNWAIVALAMLGLSQEIQAGDYLTNTNQSVSFLRNPARDAAIGIDGVYTNPAGVAFLKEGWHLSFNWQNAHQTRTIMTAYGPLFAMNMNRPNADAAADGLVFHEFKGVADAPVLPSIQAAYNTGRWSFQGGFSVSGGGGKCEFENGLGSFEGVIANIAYQSGMNGYSFTNYMRGKQYYFGFTLGAAYKVTDNLSVFAGARTLYGYARYEGVVDDIMLRGESTGNQVIPATDFFAGAKQQYLAAQQQYEALGMTAEALAAAKNVLKMGALEKITATGIHLNCKQTGIGVAPFIGVDWKLGKLNLAAKYDFKVRMRLKNDNPHMNFAELVELLTAMSAGQTSGANQAAALNRYIDGRKVAEDSPALLTLGAQYEISDRWRVMAGYHHFFDVDCKQYYGDKLGDTNEFNFGTEYDLTKKLQVSAGYQKTIYDQEDSNMSDISFNVSSYTFGFGAGYQLTEKVKLNAAYFQTNYGTKTVVETPVVNTYTRTNRVFGLGCDITL